METSPDILDELRTIAPALLPARNINVFKVPDGYFDDLDTRISTIVFINQVEKKDAQKVPEGYFNSLSDNILSKIKAREQSADEEIKEISPALHYLKQENVFMVPENYFDDLSDRIKERMNLSSAKVVSINSAKVVSINKVRKWWKYAAAAIVAGIISVTSVEIYNHGATNSNEPPYMQLAAEYKTPAEFDQGIASLNTDDIAKYLEKTTNILDDESLINNTDTIELPTPGDYLMNENTLDNYLKSINEEGLIKNN